MRRIQAVHSNWFTKPGPLAAQPFTPDNAPIELRVKAGQIPQWQEDRLNMVGLLQPSPAKTDAPVETITLIPMGAARLRICHVPDGQHGLGSPPMGRTD